MKPALAAILMACVPQCFAAEIIFSGVMTGAGPERFVVSDARSGEHSDWLTAGQSFRGYIISGFDRKREVLTVERGTEILKLPLKPPSAIDGKTHPTSESIIISFAERGRISVRDDPAVLSALQLELERLAAMNPQPTVSIATASNTSARIVKLVFELCKNSGLKKITIGPDKVADPSDAKRE